MWFLPAVLSALVFGAAGLFMKASQANGGSTNHLLLGLYLTGSLGFLLNSGFLPPDDWWSPTLWIAGLIIGAGSAWGNLIWMKALDHGPASLSSLFSNLNIVLVIVLSTWVYAEWINGWQWFGIGLLLVAVGLVSIRPGESLTIREKQWFALISLTIVLFTLRNGGLKVTEELGLSSSAVLLIGYVLSLLWFAAAVVGRRGGLHRDVPRRDNRGLSGVAARTGLFWGMLAGLCSYGGLQLYALALAMGPANIVAPIFAANSLVIAVGAILFFRETLNRLQIVAVVLLLLGLVLVRF